MGWAEQHDGGRQQPGEHAGPTGHHPLNEQEGKHGREEVSQQRRQNRSDRAWPVGERDRRDEDTVQRWPNPTPSVEILEELGDVSGFQICGHEQSVAVMGVAIVPGTHPTFAVMFVVVFVQLHA